MDIHIGQLIKKVAEEKKIKAKDLAKRIGHHSVSVSRSFKYASMQISMVKQISIALDYDLFSHYSEDLKIAKGLNTKLELEKLLEEKEKEIARLTQEVAYLKEINELLKKK